MNFFSRTALLVVCIVAGSSFASNKPIDFKTRVTDPFRITAVGSRLTGKVTKNSHLARVTNVTSQLAMLWVFKPFFKGCEKGTENDKPGAVDYAISMGLNGINMMTGWVKLPALKDFGGKSEDPTMPKNTLDVGSSLALNIGSSFLFFNSALQAVKDGLNLWRLQFPAVSTQS